MMRDYETTNTASGMNTNTSNDGIICNVCNCYYNKDKKYCTASQIKVGPTNATCSSDTVCATFRPQ